MKNIKKCSKSTEEQDKDIKEKENEVKKRVTSDLKETNTSRKPGKKEESKSKTVVKISKNEKLNVGFPKVRNVKVNNQSLDNIKVDSKKEVKNNEVEKEVIEKKGKKVEQRKNKKIEEKKEAVVENIQNKIKEEKPRNSKKSKPSVENAKKIKKEKSLSGEQKEEQVQPDKDKKEIISKKQPEDGKVNVANKKESIGEQKGKKPNKKIIKKEENVQHPSQIKQKAGKTDKKVKNNKIEEKKPSNKKKSSVENKVKNEKTKTVEKKDEEDEDIECSSVDMETLDKEIVPMSEEFYNNALSFTRHLSFLNLNEVFKMNNLYVIKHADIIFSVFGYINFNEYKNFLDAQLLKKIVAILKKKKISTDNLKVVFSERIINTPFSWILDAYKHIPLENENYLWLSKLTKPSKEDLEEIKTLFPEYKEDQLANFPVKNDEIYLLQQNMLNSVINFKNQIYGVFILNKKQQEDFFDTCNQDYER